MPRSSATSNLIQNGGFETGGFDGWATKNMANPLQPWWIAPGFEGTYAAENGFDGGGPDDYVISQDVSIPDKGSWVLSWSDAASWAVAGLGCYGTAVGASRWQYVEIRRPGTDALLETVYDFEAAYPDGFAYWTTHSVRLDQFRGKTVRIAFRQYIPECYTGPGYFGLDDVRLTSSRLALSTPPANVTPGRYWVRASLSVDDAACGPASQDLKVKVGARTMLTTTDADGISFFKVRLRKDTRMKVSYAGGGVCAPARAVKMFHVR